MQVLIREGVQESDLGMKCFRTLWKIYYWIVLIKFKKSKSEEYIAHLRQECHNSKFGVF